MYGDSHHAHIGGTSDYTLYLLVEPESGLARSSSGMYGGRLTDGPDEDYDLEEFERGNDNKVRALVAKNGPPSWGYHECFPLIQDAEAIIKVHEKGGNPVESFPIDQLSEASDLHWLITNNRVSYWMHLGASDRLFVAWKNRRPTRLEVFHKDGSHLASDSLHK